MKIAYLVANRGDIWAGSYLVDSFFLMGKNVSSVEFKYGLPVWQRQTNMAQIAVQLAGIRSGGAPASLITLTNANIDSNTGIISVRATINTQIMVEYLYFSYVIWLNTANLIGTTAIGPSPTSSLQFAGLQSLSRNQLVSRAITFSTQPVPGTISCIGSRCT